MNLQDYLLDTTGLEWPKLLATWSWLLPRELTVWFANRYGDLFIVLPDGSVYLLDIGCATFKKLASSRDEVSTLMDEGNSASDWLMIPLVDRVIAAGLVLSPGRCYGYKMSPVLGGEYSVKNTAVLPISEHYGWNGELNEQLKDLPDGSQVVLTVGKPSTVTRRPSKS